MFDKTFDVPLGNLEGLLPEPSFLKKFNKSFFSYDDFFEILSTQRNASAPGLNGISYKVFRKWFKISKFIFTIFQACFKDVKLPFNGEVIKRYGHVQKRSKTLSDIVEIEKSQIFLLFENEASCEDFSCPRVF